MFHFSGKLKFHSHNQFWVMLQHAVGQVEARKVPHCRRLMSTGVKIETVTTAESGIEIQHASVRGFGILLYTGSSDVIVPQSDVLNYSLSRRQFVGLHVPGPCQIVVNLREPSASRTFPGSSSRSSS